MKRFVIFIASITAACSAEAPEKLPPPPVPVICTCSSEARPAPKKKSVSHEKIDRDLAAIETKLRALQQRQFETDK